MKKTKYFTSTRKDSNQLAFLISEVEAQRDTFIKDFIDKIAEIENEQIQVVSAGTNSYVQVILSLTYYPKS